MKRGQRGGEFLPWESSCLCDQEVPPGLRWVTQMDDGVDEIHVDDDGDDDDGAAAVVVFDLVDLDVEEGELVVA